MCYLSFVSIDSNSCRILFLSSSLDLLTSTVDVDTNLMDGIHPESGDERSRSLDVLRLYKIKFKFKNCYGFVRRRVSKNKL